MRLSTSTRCAVPRTVHELWAHAPGAAPGGPSSVSPSRGSDLNPCKPHPPELAKRTREGIRDAGGICIEFPTHPIFENCRRPTAAMDRNLAYLGLVEILHGYPIDAVVLTTGCDKTTPAASWPPAPWTSRPSCSRVAPCLDGWHEGQLAGSGTIIWQACRKLRRRRDQRRAVLRHGLRASAPSAGHCNTMGTASTMNAVAEALGPRCPAVPPSRRPTANAPRWPTRPAAASSRWPTRT